MKNYYVWGGSVIKVRDRYNRNKEFQEMYDPSQIKLRSNVPVTNITKNPFMEQLAVL